MRTEPIPFRAHGTPTVRTERARGMWSRIGKIAAKFEITGEMANSGESPASKFWGLGGFLPHAGAREARQRDSPEAPAGHEHLESASY